MYYYPTAVKRSLVDSSCLFKYSRTCVHNHLHISIVHTYIFALPSPHFIRRSNDIILNT